MINLFINCAKASVDRFRDTFLPKNGQQVHPVRASFASFYRLIEAAHSLNPWRAIIITGFYL